MLPYKKCDTEKRTYVIKGCNLNSKYLVTVLLSIPFNKLPCNNSIKAKTTTNPSHTNGNERGILLEAKKGQNGNGAASSHAEAIPTIVNENEISCNNGVAGGQEAAKTNILGKLKAGVYLLIG